MRFSVVLAAVSISCHAVNSTKQLKFRAVDNSNYQLAKISFDDRDEQGLQNAVAYCTKIRDEAHGNAVANESWGFVLGSVGLVATATGTAVAAKSSSPSGVGIWAGVGAAGAGLTAAAIYLLASASNERTGEGLLSAAIVQMQNVDPYFLTPPVAETTDHTDTTTITRGGSGATALLPSDLDEKNCASSEKSCVSQRVDKDVHHTVTVSEVASGVKEHIRWQTCAKVLATWEAGAGTADAALATALGAKAPAGSASTGAGSGSGSASATTTTTTTTTTGSGQ
ncbi:MAG: hypothetical protein QM831_12600 [Kofleriaceae bacterium]